MRLIDVDDAIEKINCLCVDDNENWIGTENQSFVDHADVIDILSSIPTVDAVQVVRCEKCLYASQYPNENGMYKCGGILTEDGDCFLMVKPDHFCSCGERRADEENQ